MFLYGFNTCFDNLSADELFLNSLDSNLPLDVDESELLFDGWPQVGILLFAKIALCDYYTNTKIKKG